MNPYPTVLLGYDAERKVKNVVGSSRRKLSYAKPPPQPIDKVEAEVSSEVPFEVPDKESESTSYQIRENSKCQKMFLRSYVVYRYKHYTCLLYTSPSPRDS